MAESAGQTAQDIAILVVDDEPSVREVLADYLDSQGYAVQSEANGERGIAALDKRAFDIVITDLRMPGMSGLDLLRRAREKHPDAEVIVITGYATIEDGVEAMRAGAYDFLLKPLRLGQLEAVLSRCIAWVRHRRSHAELEAVNRRLLELTRLKERFLAVTDHELRTPVTVLDGMLHHVLRQHRGELSDKARERLESLCGVSRRLVDLVRDVHDVLQSRGHPLPVHREEVPAADIARRLEVDLDMVRFSRSLDIGLRDDTPVGLTLWGDGHRLGQAASELVQNAAKATPDGGTVAVRLWLDGAARPERLCVTVKDTGVGISDEEQTRIFDFFHGVGDERHHHSSKFEYLGGGLGIGLSIAREIARAHGGGVELQSAVDQGSTFTLWVPVQARPGAD